MFTAFFHRLPALARSRLRLPPGDLLRDPIYRRLWLSILISSFGGQVTMLALPLTAAVLLHATPTQMGLLTAMEIAPFVLFSLPAGVWLDRWRKLPVYVVGEGVLALAVASVPLAWWMGWLGMTWLYVVGFVMGSVYTIAGSAAQIVLTQIVERDRLVEAHAKNALANSAAEVAGPGAAPDEEGERHRDDQPRRGFRRARGVEPEPRQHAGQQRRGERLRNAVHHALERARQAGQHDQRAAGDEGAHRFGQGDALGAGNQRSARRRPGGEHRLTGPP